MKKAKILLPLALLGMVFGVAACNSNGGDKKEEPGQSEQAEQVKINITAPEGKKSIMFGETLQLSADQDGVAWESSKPEVATVSATGLVTAVSKGSTTIKATKEGFKDGSYSVSVNYPDITLTASGEKDILIGGQVTLTASEQGVTWSSSDPEVAKVENGVVTGLKLGTATIKASKEHFNDGTAVINVVRPEASAKLDLTIAADHYSADGWWELPSAGGMGFAMQQVAGWCPIASQASWGQQVENPETFIGGFGEGDKETVVFTAAAAGKAELVLDLGNSDAVTLAEVMSVKLNDTAVSLEGIELEEHPGQYFGNDLVFGELSLGELDLVEGNNTIVFEFLDETNIFLNELAVYAGGAVTLVPPAAKEQIEVAKEELEVIEEATVQIESEETELKYASVDETIATVDEYGLVTGVKMGKTYITVMKDGMYSVRVEITVNPKPVEGQVLLEAEKAEELKDVEPGFNQGGPSIMEDGGQFGGNAVHSGGAYVSYWGGSSLTLTLKFEATEAKTMVLSVVGNAPASWGGEASPLVFKDSATVTFNDTALEFDEQAFPAASGMNPEMVEVELGDVNVIAGENTLVVTFTGSIPSLDVFKLSPKAA